MDISDIEKEHQRIHQEAQERHRKLHEQALLEQESEHAKATEELADLEKQRQQV